MEAVVSDILRDRMREPGGLTLTAVLSIAAHAGAIAAIALIPGVLPRANTAPPIVMTISLGGTPGPQSGGLTMLGGRNIVAARPSLAPKIDKMVLPSAQAEPAMVLPVPDPRMKPKTPPKPTAASKDPAGSNVGRGFETQKGSTNVETGARGMGFGLSSGGGGSTGGYLDVKNFCCPEYLEEMIARITRSWQQQQSSTGTVRMKFTIQRSGQLTDIQVEESSNISALDLASERALRLTDHLQPLPSAFPEERLPVHIFFEYKKMKHLFIAASWVAALGVLAAQTAPQQPPAPSGSGQTEINIAITGDIGAPLHYAVPDFLALTTDPETVAAAKMMGEVLWNDLAFEREFDMIPRDTYRTIPQAQSATDIPFDRWRELGADGVVMGTVARNGAGFRVEMRLFNVKSRQIALGKIYEGITLRNPRAGAHWAADDIHEQRGLRGVARTRLTFTSDRDNERLADTVEKRESKNIYISDYDGANQIRVTPGRRLNINPNWAPDGRSIAYSGYGAVVPQILISNLYLGTRDTVTDDKSSAFLPVFSPDGTKICFMSNRDGNAELYVMNRDGSNVRRLTNNPANDVTPTWSPTGTQIAFTSDRSGSAQLWVMDTDGLNTRRLTFSDSYADRATWSPAPFNEIAYAARSGPGFDIRIYDVATAQSRQLTNGEGSNESPAFAPNGRHLAFTSTRAGKVQIFVIARDGKNLQKLTSAGNNWTPNWSK